MSIEEFVSVGILPASTHREETEKRTRRIKLYRAALCGDDKYEIHQDNITAKISKKEDTALHIGAVAKSCKFARKLLPKLKTLEDLVVKNKSCNTAFWLAAASGKLELAKEMIEVAREMVNQKNYGILERAHLEDLEKEEIMNNGEYLAQVKGNKGLSPLRVAVLYGREEMVYWLYYLTKTSLNHADCIGLLLALIRNGFHELALQLLEEYEDLAIADKDGETALLALVQLPVTNQKGVWKRIKRCFKR